MASATSCGPLAVGEAAAQEMAPLVATGPGCRANCHGEVNAINGLRVPGFPPFRLPYEASESGEIAKVVEFDAGATIGMFGSVRLRRLFAGILECEVDLVTRDAFHPAMKDRILEEAVRAA